MNTIRGFFSDVYMPLNLRGRSESNQRQYEIQFKHLARFLCREPLLSDLTDETITRFLGWMLDNHAAPTVNKARSHLLALWRCAARKRLVENFPDVSILPEPDLIPRAWTAEEITSLLVACRKVTGEICGVPAAGWWESVHRVWFDGGERTWALLAADWHWLEIGRCLLRVPAKHRKGGHKEMVYQLRTPTIQSIVAIQKPKRSMIWPWPYSQPTFYRHYNQILEEAGLPTDSKSKPQRMRRSFASHLEAAGGNATKALKHSSRKVTEKSYLDPTITGEINLVNLLPPV